LGEPAREGQAAVEAQLINKMILIKLIESHYDFDSDFTFFKA
jgi:hypothetical protein